MTQQPLIKLPLNFDLLNHIIMIINIYMKPNAMHFNINLKIRIKVSIMANRILSYYTYNFLARKTKWWRLTTDIKSTILISFGFI